MDGDLISVRVLVVSASESECDLLRKGGALASVPADIVEADGAKKAGTILSSGGVDVVLICGELSEPERAAIVKSARATPSLPLTVLLAGEATHTAARGDGAILPDAVITNPVGLEAARKAIDNCIRTRLPSRALVVDDSPTMRSIVRKILLACSFKMEIAEASDGATAVKRVRDEGHEIVFLDYNMPGLDGLATLAELRRARPDVVVVIMTSTQDDAVADRARAAGASAFLKKPFFPADIDALLYGRYGLTPLRQAT